MPRRLFRGADVLDDIRVAGALCELHQFAFRFGRGIVFKNFVGEGDSAFDFARARESLEAAAACLDNAAPTECANVFIGIESTGFVRIL